jgi:hypothetical protein
MEKVFDGGIGSLELNNHTITVAYIIDDERPRYGYPDEEIMAYGKRYRERTPIPHDMEIEKERLDMRVDVTLIVKCFYNLDTGERKIIDGEYALVYRQ